MSYRSFDSHYRPGMRFGLNVSESTGGVCLCIGQLGADSYIHLDRADVHNLMTACLMALRDLNTSSETATLPRDGLPVLEAAE